MALLLGVEAFASDLIECARLDTLDVLPLSTEADIDAYLVQKEKFDELGIWPSMATRIRVYEASSRLGLDHQRLLQIAEVLYAYSFEANKDYDVSSYADDLLANVGGIEVKYQANCYNTLGNYYEDSGNSAQAIKCYLQSYESATSEGLETKIYAIGNLGAIYLDNGDTTKALDAIYKSFDLTKLLKSETERAYNQAYDYVTLARLTMSSVPIDTVDKYFKLSRSAINVYDKSHPRYSELLREYFERFIPYKMSNKLYDEADILIDSIVRFVPDQGHIFRAQYYIDMGEYELAYQLLKDKSFRYRPLEMERVDLMLQLVGQLKRYDEAYDFANLQLSRLHEDLTKSKRSLHEISDRLVRNFDKQRASTKLQHEQELKLLKSRQRIWIAAFGILLSLGLATWALSRYRESHLRSQGLSEVITSHERDLEKTNQELERQLKALEQFNHLLSHDLREPIRSITSFTSLLGRDLKPYPQLQGNFEFLRSGVNQLTHLLAGIEALRTIKEHEFITSIGNVYALVHDVANKSRYRNFIQVNASGLNKKLKFDQYLLRVILEEVIDNAAKFNISENPVVSVNAFYSKSNLIFQVYDNGIGVAEEYHGQIFKLFKRLNRREEFGGAGIGLALVAIAAQKMNAVTNLDSSPKGSVFTITVPRIRTLSKSESSVLEVGVEA